MVKGEAVLRDAREAVRHARLSYVSGETPGIKRKRHGRDFEYVDPRGRRIRKTKTLERIRKLAIPPAWKDVWICPSERGHIQAVGRDARGRKQYKYHENWRQVRDEGKFNHVVAFARALPRIRKITSKHLRQKHLSREKVLAAVVQVMEKTLIRVGNDEYAKQNRSYGLTTLHDRHVTIVKKRKVTFEFRGKSGVEHEIDLDEARLAKIIKECRDLPGEELFQYLDENGDVHDVGSADVNAYLKEITGRDFTAKDFRTWAGTVLAAKALQQFEKAETKKAIKANLVKAIESVASRLGNTRAVCKKCYIHPAILNAYLDGDLIDRLKSRAKAELEIAKEYALNEDENAVLRVLDRKL